MGHAVAGHEDVIDAYAECVAEADDEATPEDLQNALLPVPDDIQSPTDDSIADGLL